MKVACTGRQTQSRRILTPSPLYPCDRDLHQFMRYSIFSIHNAGGEAAWHPTYHNPLDPNRLSADLDVYVSLQAKTPFKPYGFGI